MLIANAEQYTAEQKRVCNHYKFNTSLLERVGVRSVFEMDSLQKELNTLGWSMEAITMHEYALQKNSYLQSYVDLDSSRVDCLSDEALLDIVNSAAFREAAYVLSRVDGWGSLCYENSEGSRYMYSPRLHVALELYNYDFMSSRVSVKVRYGKKEHEIKDFVFFDIRQVAAQVSSLVEDDLDTEAAYDDCFYLIKDFFKACVDYDDSYRECHSFNADRTFNVNRYGVLKYMPNSGNAGVILSVRVAFYDGADKCYITDVYVGGRYVRTVFTRVHPDSDFCGELTGYIEYLANKFGQDRN